MTAGVAMIVGPTTKPIAMGDLRVSVPTDWDDITAELPAGMPFTLARQDGVGALQFSVGTYTSGALPHVTMDDLRRLLSDRAASHDLGAARELTVFDADNVSVRGDFSTKAETCLVWYWSDRRSVALVTYVGIGPSTLSRLAARLGRRSVAARIAQERAEAQAIIDSAAIAYAPDHAGRRSHGR